MNDADRFSVIEKHINRMGANIREICEWAERMDARDKEHERRYGLMVELADAAEDSDKKLKQLWDERQNDEERFGI